jgi:hypothetical protein
VKCECGRKIEENAATRRARGTKFRVRQRDKEEQREQQVDAESSWSMKNEERAGGVQPVIGCACRSPVFRNPLDSPSPPPPPPVQVTSPRINLTGGDVVRFVELRRCLFFCGGWDYLSVFVQLPSTRGPTPWLWGWGVVPLRPEPAWAPLRCPGGRQARAGQQRARREGRKRPSRRLSRESRCCAVLHGAWGLGAAAGCGQQHRGGGSYKLQTAAPRLAPAGPCRPSPLPQCWMPCVWESKSGEGVRVAAADRLSRHARPGKLRARVGRWFFSLRQALRTVTGGRG